MFKLDEIWWLVTPQNPHKILKPATYKERINNCKIISKNRPIKIKEIEKKINSKYTYKSLNYILNHYPNIKFFWLMGADNLINFHKWQNWKQIFNEISVVVFKRHGYNTMALKSIVCRTFSQVPTGTVDLTTTRHSFLRCSATDEAAAKRGFKLGLPSISGGVPMQRKHILHVSNASLNCVVKEIRCSCWFLLICAIFSGCCCRRARAASTRAARTARATALAAVGPRATPSARASPSRSRRGCGGSA